MALSAEILKRPEFWIAIISYFLGVLGKSHFHWASLLRRKGVALSAFSLGLVATGFFLGYLRYGRQWIWWQTTGPLYDFSVNQHRKTWCQWAIEPQDEKVLEAHHLRVFQQFVDTKDLLFEGRGRARVGYLGADRPFSEEPPGRLGVGVFDYEMPKFAATSTADLVLDLRKDPQFGTPSAVAIQVNDHALTSVKLSDVSAEDTGLKVHFPAAYLASDRKNYIYFGPDLGGPPSEKTSFVYIISLQIHTH